MAARVGQGSDIHKIGSDRPLRLGGLDFPGLPGLIGHSDGDCVVHALMDALIGAAGLGDIGGYFPDTDEQWRGADSMAMLRDVVARLRGLGARIENADITVHCKAPRLGERKREMAATLAAALGIDVARVNIKGKSGNGLGPVGEGIAIAADAVALLEMDTPA